MINYKSFNLKHYLLNAKEIGAYMHLTMPWRDEDIFVFMTERKILRS